MGSVLICKELFKDRYSDTYPKINAATTFCSAVVASGVGFIYDAFGSYTPALVILLAGIAVQVAATFIAFRSARKNAMA